jgi:hypothetical protein
MNTPGVSVEEGSGTLANIEFDVCGDPGSSSSLTVSYISLNDGDITVELSDGVFNVGEPDEPVYQIFLPLILQ